MCHECFFWHVGHEKVTAHLWIEELGGSLFRRYWLVKRWSGLRQTFKVLIKTGRKWLSCSGALGATKVKDRGSLNTNLVLNWKSGGGWIGVEVRGGSRMRWEELGGAERVQEGFRGASSSGCARLKVRSRETQEQGTSRVKIQFSQMFRRISFGLSENSVLPKQIGVWVR